MHWERAHVNPMVALRTVAYGDRWAEAWPHITAQQRQQARTVSADRHNAHAREAQAQAQADRPKASAQAAQPAAPRRRTSTPTQGRRPHKPAADHPWRRGSFGHPRCA